MDVQPLEARRLARHADEMTAFGVLAAREHLVGNDLLGRDLAEIEGDQLLVLLDVDERKAAGADATRAWVHDAEHQRGRDGAIDRVATGVQRVERRTCGLGVVGRDTDGTAVGRGRESRACGERAREPDGRRDAAERQDCC
ncbi:MAG: hypothetical protein JWM74_6114 [Myxococcaceae bacterium]|nr:hypothetical protein [Myxococcaceae bacterium]